MGPDLDPVPLSLSLREDLGHRRIDHGIETLRRLRSSFSVLPARAGYGVLVGLIAQWVDAGFDEPALLRCFLERFPRELRPALPVTDYLHLRMAEAVLAMEDEDFEGAAACLTLVQSFEPESGDAELAAIANFWLGRCHRRMGRYAEAQRCTERAEAQAAACGYHEMAAVMQVTRSWLAFQRGRMQEALALLRQAEAILLPTRDFRNRGNIQSAYGRIARRQGQYQRALDCFERAIAEYRSGGGGHVQLARTLLNLAFVERLLALDAQRNLERTTGSRREERIRIESIRASASSRLAEAYAIYEQHHNHRGMAGVHINRGFLALDAGDLERAAAEGDRAFTHGAEKSDPFVMARARTLQCIAENAAIEDQVGDAAHHRDIAESLARDAVAFAGRTENRRLLARAYVWRGLTLTATPPDLDAARRCYEQASALLQTEGMERQYTWDDLETLRGRVVHARPVDSILRAWSAGIVENTTFQRMTEEFARIVIPKVWEREGCKISRVAQKLSISPKKVRRVLHAAGVSPTSKPKETSRV